MRRCPGPCQPRGGAGEDAAAVPPVTRPHDRHRAASAAAARRSPRAASSRAHRRSGRHRQRAARRADELFEERPARRRQPAAAGGGRRGGHPRAGVRHDQTDRAAALRSVGGERMGTTARGRQYRSFGGGAWVRRTTGSTVGGSSVIVAAARERDPRLRRSRSANTARSLSTRSDNRPARVVHEVELERAAAGALGSDDVNETTRRTGRDGLRTTAQPSPTTSSPSAYQRYEANSAARAFPGPVLGAGFATRTSSERFAHHRARRSTTSSRAVRGVDGNAAPVRSISSRSPRATPTRRPLGWLDIGTASMRRRSSAGSSVVTAAGRPQAGTAHCSSASR